MTAETTVPRRSFGQTMRSDVWWIHPLLVFLGLSTFIVYSTWAAFQGTHYFFGNYVSPFYSPEIFGNSPHAWFGGKPNWWPSWLFFSPALLILWAPGGFRLTCYYYRGAYYKAFWADPPACTIGELDSKKPTAVYCGSGYRASIAASILKEEGFDELWNVPGSWEAWRKAKLPVEGADGE